MTNWINTVSREHVRRAVEGNFTQADHGKPDRLRRMSGGDRIAFYSPKTDYPEGDPLQAFTAIGRLVGDEVYQVDMSADFHPYRRTVEFLDCAETPIRPLIDHLNFIEDKKRWGFRFRFGLFQVSDQDFEVIEAAMTRSVAGGAASVA
jgi:EVE domain